jgi:hypothetical protein
MFFFHRLHRFSQKSFPQISQIFLTKNSKSLENIFLDFPQISRIFTDLYRPTGESFPA